VLKQPALTFQAATIARQVAISANHTMTGHRYGNWIGAIGEPYRARGRRIADAFGQFTVTYRRAAGDITQAAPDLLLKR